MSSTTTDTIDQNESRRAPEHLIEATVYNTGAEMIRHGKTRASIELPTKRAYRRIASEKNLAGIADMLAQEFPDFANQLRVSGCKMARAYSKEHQYFIRFELVS